ncbi:uncharacterized protein LOC101845193 [Aplysia californica]|uniref:Uncharacterized protein LOC101845193 n=1 Tax=Aplysia californica TaxID=6500 RepID=A0ABM0K2C3_APLCA|nr:uncharacterized protein LOC101845193 [Aplysia californica]XP_005107091.1 uncharacterized protein LOC101845193 [Aplysia californica]
MPSASMYASPYTYKEPPRRINYPPLFSSLNNLTFRYIFDSKILALSALLLLVSFIVITLMAIMPFWFELVLSQQDGTFGQMQEKPGITINTGIFFMREDHFDNLIFLNKFSNEDVVPKTLAFAQVCSIIGNCIITCCLVATLILVFRRFGSATGTIMLAGAATVGALFQILAVVFCGVLLLQSNCEPSDQTDENGVRTASSDCDYTENQVWRMIPMYTQLYRVEPHLTPYVKPNWAFYIAALGALLCVASAVMLWLEAITTGKSLKGIRYQQMRQVRDPHENDIAPTGGRKFVYAAPQNYGPGSYGMQPVMAASGPYQTRPMYAPPHPPAIGFGGPPQTIGFHPGMSRRPESESGSSGVVTREIDL